MDLWLVMLKCAILVTLFLDVYCLLPVCKYIYFTMKCTVTCRYTMFILEIYLLSSVTE